MFRVSAVLGLVCFLCSPVCAAARAVQYSSLASGRVLEPVRRGGEFFAGEIIQSDKSVLIANDDWYISVKAAAMHDFRPAATSVYSIEAESDHAELRLWVTDVDGTPLAVGKRLQDRLYRQHLAVRMEAGTTYNVFVGTSGEHFPVRYRLGVVAGERTPLSLSPVPSRLKVIPPLDETQMFGGGDDVFEGLHAKYFELSRITSEHPWVRVTASSTDIDPVVFILDGADRVLGFSDDVGDGSSDAEAVAKWPGGTLSIVVCSFGGVWDKPRPTSAKLHLGVRTFEHDPRELLWVRVSRYLRDPLLALAIGAAISLLLTVLAFKISNSRRTIEYSVREDTLVVDHSDAAKSGSPVIMFGEEVTNVGMCKVQFRYRGLRDLEAADVRSPIEAKIGSITRILTTKADRQGGWGEPSATAKDPTSIVVPVDHLQSGDSLSVTVFYEQETVVEPTCTVTGRLVNGRLRHAQTGLDQAFSRFYIVVTAIVLLLVMPLVLFDSVFDVMPAWWYKLTRSFFSVWTAIYLFFLLGTRMGRRFVVQMARILVRLPSSLARYARRLFARSHET